MSAGRPKQVDPGSLYAMAHLLYWDLRRLAEGTFRWKFDRKKFQSLTDNLDSLQVVDDQDRARYREEVEQEIREGRLEISQREQRLKDIEQAETFVRREVMHRDAAELAQTQIKVPPEPDVISVLLNPSSTAQQIRDICKEAVMTRTVTVGGEVRKLKEYPAWPLPVGSPLPVYLSQYAEQHIEALRHPRFPSCDVSFRPTNRLKQLWFVSRALAGAVYGVKTRTAINLVGSLRPEKVFEESRAAKAARKHKRKIARRHQKD